MRKTNISTRFTKTPIAIAVEASLKLIGIAAITLSASGTAMAQTDEAVLEEVVVQGIRASLQEAAEIKRASDVIVDVISAEDIGQFPDQNLAESLQRISGVQISRNRGEGEDVTVRGLSPDFTNVQYNGRALPSATGGRSFDFTILPSDFVSAVEVYKTPSADIEEGALSATVNVRTARPLEVGRDLLVGTLKAVSEENSGEVSPDITLLYNNVSEDESFGFSVGAHFDSRDVEAHIFEAFGLEPATEAAKGLDYNVDGDTLDSVRFNHASNFGLVTEERERTTFIAAAQWRPSEGLDIWTEILYSEFDVQGARALNAHRWTNIVGSIVDSNVIDDPLGSEGLVDFLEVIGVDNRNNARTTDSNDELTAFSLGGEYQVGGFVAEAEFSYGKSENISSALSHEVIGRADASYDLRDDPGGIHTVEYAAGYNPLTDGNFRSLGFNGNFNQPTTDENIEFRIDVDKDVKWDFTDEFGITSVEFGGKYSSREKFNGFRRLAVTSQALAGLLGETFDPTIEGGSFDATDYLSTFNPSGFLDGYSGGATFPSTWLSAGVDNLLSFVSIDELLAAGTISEGGASEINVTEDVTAAYLKFNFHGLDDRLSGNFGLRYVSTDQTSAGNIADFNTVTFDQGGAVTLVDTSPSSISRTYSELLPSFNLKFQASDDVVIRFGAATVMSRPSLSVLSPATTINVNVRTINSSNPNVDPFLADQIDLSFEWYYGDTGVLSIAPFAKFVESFIVSSTQQEQVTFSDPDGTNPQTATFTRFLPDNGSGTDLFGFEINWIQPLDFLVDGMGISANYTVVHADDIQAAEDGPFLPIDGLSEESYNIVGFYENERFGARLAYNYRDGFVNNGTNFFGDGSFTDPYDQLDFSASYDVTDNVTVVFEALNLTNEVLVQVNSLGINRGLEDTGRRLTAGVRASF